VWVNAGRRKPAMGGRGESPPCIVYPLSSMSRPVGVSAGKATWHAARSNPVCRAKLGTATAGRIRASAATSSAAGATMPMLNASSHVLERRAAATRRLMLVVEASFVIVVARLRMRAVTAGEEPVVRRRSSSPAHPGAPRKVRVGRVNRDRSSPDRHHRLDPVPGSP
jgi:hypothetical protein